MRADLLSVLLLIWGLPHSLAASKAERWRVCISCLWFSMTCVESQQARCHTMKSSSHFMRQVFRSMSHITFLQVWVSKRIEVKKSYHFINLCGVELLNVSEDPDVVISDKVDGDTLPAKSTRSPNAVDVQLTRIWEIIVDDQWHLHMRQSSDWRLSLYPQCETLCTIWVRDVKNLLTGLEAYATQNLWIELVSGLSYVNSPKAWGSKGVSGQP